MCETTTGDHDRLAQASMPRVAQGVAVDPVAVEPVDEVEVVSLVDNSFDALVADDGPARRATFAGTGSAAASHFVDGVTAPGLVAEHGFSALVRVRQGATVHTVLFDTGVSPNGLVDNANRLGIDLAQIEVIVLSHGHWDHCGGLAGLARVRGRAGLPLTVHPLVWTRRRIVAPSRPIWDLPTLSRQSVEHEGFTVIERRQPSLLLAGSVLITGEVDRTTEFERGLPFHEAWQRERWEPDPLIVDDQALVVHVRGRGLVVITGCGHAGAVNIARHAMRLTGVPRLHAFIGGFHLSGPAFEPVIEPTVDAFVGLAPDLVVPAHCTGWKAAHRLAAAMPAAFIPNAVGTSYTLSAN
jgi:7,8-dihydropterin-6-yl-methyl-4-(beta-D-ribofuranosyl)aminobenzene 5'-phosphate synthase